MKALHHTRPSQRGVTLVELLVALAVSMVIVIAAASLLVTTSRSRDTQDAAGMLQDSARFATDIITRSVQQAGYQNYVWTEAQSFRRESVPAADGQPDLRGFNNSSAVASSSGSAPDNGQHNRASSPTRINNSDTLVVRYQGSGSGAGDGNMINCLGQSVPAPTSTVDRAYSIFYVAQSANSTEPELFCKYVPDPVGSPLTFQSASIVRGVETFQVLYGVDTDNDSFADTWMSAEQVDAVAIANKGVSSPWQLVRAVRVGMVIRSADRVTVNPTPASQTFAPLGDYFSQGGSDTQTFNMTDGRLRKTVTFTINMRNSL